MQTIRIHNVPDSLHRKLVVRAAAAGMSLSDYLPREIRIAAERPMRGEILDRLARLRSVTPESPPARAVRNEREAK